MIGPIQIGEIIPKQGPRFVSLRLGGVLDENHQCLQ